MSDRDIVGTFSNEPCISGQFEPDIIIKGSMEARFPASVFVISPIQLDRTGGNYTFSLDLNEVIANLPPSGVASVFGRTGDVVAQSGDYTFAQIGSTPTTLSGYGITDAQPLDSDLTAIAALTTTSFGRGYLTLADASASRTYLALVPGTDIQTYDSDLAALAANSTNGLWARTGSGTGAARTITGPAAGITVTNGDGVSGNPTLALANDLAALEGLATTGLIARTATDTATTRTITGTANAISVTNGDGVSGNPTLAISTDAALPGNPTTTTQAVDNSSTRIATTAYVIGQAASATPLVNAATAVVGTSTRFARADHVHPGREVLSGARTYYVRTDGSNSNSGLANTSGGAFLTIQKAIDVVAALDLSIYNVTIQVADGTYTGGVIVNGPWIGSGDVTLQGNVSTPANVVISTTSAHCISVQNNGRLKIGGMKLQTTTFGIGLVATAGGRIDIVSPVNFGACATYHMNADGGGKILCSSNYTISGNTSVHAVAISFGYFYVAANTITLSGTPAFGTFAQSTRLGYMEWISNTFSGSATGPRYNATTGGAIFTNGGGASYLPGNSAGSATSPGWYA